MFGERNISPSRRTTDEQIVHENSHSETESSEDSMEDTQEMEITHDAVKANMFKDRGNEYFKKGNFDEAINSYTIAIQADVSNPVLYGNRAIALLKKADLLCSKLRKGDPIPKSAVDFYQAADQDCSQALRLDKDFVKAHFRRGMARKALGMLSEALFDFETVGKLDPGNSMAEKNVQTLKMELWAKGKVQKRYFTEFKSTPVVPCPKNDDWTGELKRMRIEELNIGHKPSETISSDVTEEKMDVTVKVAVPPPPSTAYQFYEDWRHLERHPLERAEYLLSIEPQTIKEIFKHSIEVDVLSDIITLLHKVVFANENAASLRVKIPPLLEALTHVGRFDTLVMFLDEEETRKLNEMLRDETEVRKLWKLE